MNKKFIGFWERKAPKNIFLKNFSAILCILSLYIYSTSYLRIFVATVISNLNHAFFFPADLTGTFTTVVVRRLLKNRQFALTLLYRFHSLRMTNVWVHLIIVVLPRTLHLIVFLVTLCLHALDCGRRGVDGMRWGNWRLVVVGVTWSLIRSHHEQIHIIFPLEFSWLFLAPNCF